MAAVGAAVRMPLYRPLVGDDKIEIMDAARKIGTHDISAEPFHDCCPIFLPRNPALHASVEELDQAESKLDIERSSARESKPWPSSATATPRAESKKWNRSSPPRRDPNSPSQYRK